MDATPSYYGLSNLLRALTSLIPLPVKYTQTPLRRRHHIQSLDRDLLRLLQHPNRVLCNFLRKQRPVNRRQF